MKKESCNEFLAKIKEENKDMHYYSRINAIGIYKLVRELPYCKELKEGEINNEIKNISQLLGYQCSRVDKDISIYKSNIERMKQALEIIALNTSSTK